MILGTFTTSKVMADVGLFMDTGDAVKLSLASPRANHLLSRHRTLDRNLSHISVSRKMICISDQNGSTTLRMDEKEDSAKAQIVCLLKTKKILFNSGRITASSGNFIRFLAHNTKKAQLHNIFAGPSLVNDEVLLLLAPGKQIIIHPLDPTDTTPTAITDEFLNSANIKPSHLSLRGFFNTNLNFPTICNFYEAKSRSECRLGIIGSDQMPIILEYFKSGKWSIWETTLYNNNDHIFLQFTHIFHGCSTLDRAIGISLNRDSNGFPCEIASVPKEFVNAKSFECFKLLVKDLKPDFPIEYVVANSVILRTISVSYEDRIGQVSIRGSMELNPVFQYIDDQEIVIVKTNVDQRTVEDLFVKLLRASGTVKFVDVYNCNLPFILTDRLFASLLEHAGTAKVDHFRKMKLQLSPENLEIFYEKRTSDGLFKNREL